MGHVPRQHLSEYIRMVLWTETIIHRESVNGIDEKLVFLKPKRSNSVDIP